MAKVSSKLLKDLGLVKAGNKLEERKEFERKCNIAYEHYRAVTPEHIAKHNEKLKQNTLQETGTKGKDLTHQYDRLDFIPLKDYGEIPPETALNALKEAKERNCFDSFEVCKIKSVKEYKDPIIFGKVKNCPDIFFISQWEDDIKIEDILEEGEG